jgi:hypothetical protein
MSGQVPPESFGQRTDHTCAVACLRYVLYCQKGINHSEEALLQNSSNPQGFIPEREDGNSLAGIAEAASRLEYVPRIRCLTGNSELIGNVPQGWIQHGSEAALREWLKRTVERQPVMVSLDTSKLPPPYDPVWGDLHSVVVVNIDGDQVEYLEPDPPQQNTYPKRAEYKFLDFNTFMNAWRLVGYLALYIEE